MSRVPIRPVDWLITGLVIAAMGAHIAFRHLWGDSVALADVLVVIALSVVVSFAAWMTRPANLGRLRVPIWIRALGMVALLSGVAYWLNKDTIAGAMGLDVRQVNAVAVGLLVAFLVVVMRRMTRDGDDS